LNTEAIARRVVDRLHEAGFIAYYAGGCVRDRLLSLPSADYDVATSASPEEVQELFEETVPVGIAFGSVIVLIEGLPTEVTTFRNDIHDHYEGGRRPHKIERATAQEDAERRSFTINGMFYDPIEGQVIDFVGGQEDLKKGIVRAIGNPDLRFKEDRLRMIRGVRFAARFEFEFEPATRQAIIDHAHLLFPAVSMERIWQELHKMAAHRHFPEAMRMLGEFGLLREIFPLLEGLDVEAIDPSEFIEKAPLVVQLMPLFRHLSLDQRLEMVARCKPSKAELARVSFLTKAEQLLKSAPQQSREWVDLFAHPDCHLALQRLSHKEEELKRWQERLAEPIRRARERSTLVTARMLMEVGIKPGPEMGRLIDEAEKMAIEEGLNDPQAVINRLISKPLP